jgi:predicted RNase H-like HicB family nuclease
MARLFKSWRSPKVDADTLYALQYKLPDSVRVTILEEPEGGYSARAEDLGGNVVTQADTGPELFEMVNDAILTSFDIPEEYRLLSKNYYPPAEVREQLKIPHKYLRSGVELIKA